MFFKQLACYVDTTELYTNIRPNVVIPAFVRALFGWTLAVSAVWPATSSAHLGTSGAACQKTQIHTSRYILYLFVVAVIIYLYDIYIYIYICIAASDYITLMAPRLIGATGSALEFYIRINLLSRLVHIVFSWLLQSLRLCTCVQICSYTTCSACLHMHVWRDGASAAASNGSTCGLHHGKPTFDTT